MCMLCSADKQEKEFARKNCIAHAEQFERMAQAERNLASGTWGPHELPTGIHLLAKSLIRYLVSEWL